MYFLSLDLGVLFSFNNGKLIFGDKGLIFIVFLHPYMI